MLSSYGCGNDENWMVRLNGAEWVGFMCRDGMERLEVSDGATVGELKQKIGQQLHISVKDLKLSQQQTLVRCASSIGL